MTGQTPWCQCPIWEPCTCGREAPVVRCPTNPTGWKGRVMDQQGETP